MSTREFASICLIAIAAPAMSQVSGDSLLASERSIDRPLTLHAKQFRIEAGYGLFVNTKRYDADGDAVKLRDEGLSYLRHEWLIDFRYGIAENLQLTLSTKYKKQAQRIEQVLTLSAYEYNELSEIKTKVGVEDLLIALSGRAPFTQKSLDLVATGGIYIPIGPDEAQRPDNSVQADPNIGYQSFVYRYNERWGSGAPVATIGGFVKHRGQDMAVTASAIYDYPLKESKNKRWEHQLVDGTFYYQSSEYSYQLPGFLRMQLEVERQLAPYFDLSLQFLHESSSGGWSEVSGSKVSIDKQSRLSFNPGYEILVTSKIWIRQRLMITLSGKSMEAPFGINTSIVYNFFSK